MKPQNAKPPTTRTSNIVLYCLGMAILPLTILSACKAVTTAVIPNATANSSIPSSEVILDIFKKPLVTNIYTADPSAHVFQGRIYIYPSHDLDHNNPPPADNDGDQFDMEDYHVFSMDNMHMLPVDHGEVLNVKNVPWASKQMWAPDAAYKNGTYYLYFPARDQDHLFRIGVATSKSPAGPFKPESDYIQGSFSIDPCVFVDDDGQAYMIFGGLWGGQLEKWTTGEFDPDGTEPNSNEPALGPRIARLSADMLSFEGPAQEISILDEYKTPILAGEEEKRFFEASWMHKYNGMYYLSYSTGTSHYIAYATSDKPTGPFISRGILLKPVLGWTTHHSIVEFQGKWYLFYHDATLSEGIDYKRNIKVAELTYNPDGTIQTIAP
jgi:beta-xylosidase